MFNPLLWLSKQFTRRDKLPATIRYSEIHYIGFARGYGTALGLVAVGYGIGKVLHLLGVA